MPPTAYAKHQEFLRKKERNKKDGAQRHVAARAGAKCGAKKRQGGHCQMAAGFGTAHLGIGHCKYHGGNLPNMIKNAITKESILLGAPKEINPLDAIIWCIKLTAGEVQFYTEQIKELDETEWIDTSNDILGRQLHIFARERSLAQDRLVRYSKIAVDLGLAERAVRLAEQYGNTIARLLGGLLDDLRPYLSDEGVKIIPALIRKHLMIAESGHRDIELPRKQQELTE